MLTNVTEIHTAPLFPCCCFEQSVSVACELRLGVFIFSTNKYFVMWSHTHTHTHLFSFLEKKVKGTKKNSSSFFCCLNNNNSDSAKRKFKRWKKLAIFFGNLRVYETIICLNICITSILKLIKLSHDYEL